jgi:GMP synthase-like glutamine amidotransferase
VPRKVLAFRHVPFESLGMIADSLEEHQIAFEYVDLYRDIRCADARAVDGLIFMGGPMSANDELPYIRQELELISEAVSRGLPILGVCLGSQLIAKALGARVYQNAEPEIGWYPVDWTAAVARDRLHQGLSAPETVFHWHSETFDLPPSAELLAHSAACRNQAYRVGANVYGLQYHLEVTPEMLEDWRAEIPTPIDPHVNAARLKKLAAQVFGRWCDLVASSKTGQWLPPDFPPRSYAPNRR